MVVGNDIRTSQVTHSTWAITNLSTWATTNYLVTKDTMDNLSYPYYLGYHKS